MLSEMVKQANCTIGERVKVAAAIVFMHAIDREQDIMATAGDIQKNASYRGVAFTDEQAIAASLETYAEKDTIKIASLVHNMEKNAGMKDIWSKTKDIASQPGVRIPGLAVAGGGLAAGGAALAGEDDPKVLALAALLGGGAGAFMGSKPKELERLRELIKTKAVGV